MMSRLKTILVVGLAAVPLIAYQADGHMYQLSPASRQLFLSPVFQDWLFEPMEYCPSCYNARGPEYVKDRGERLTDPAFLDMYGGGEWPLLTAWENGETADNGNYLEPDEIAVRHGVCGDPEQNSEEGSNMYSTPNSEWPILETFQEGKVLDIKLVVTVYHWGHVEFFICNSEDMEDPDGVVNQGCFNMHALTRAEGDSVNSPIDPNYPGRYYVGPKCRTEETDQAKPEGAQKGYVAHMQYQLPEGLTCKRCIMQMVYYTGHTCKHPGYDEFNPPSWPSQCAPNKGDWMTPSYYKNCGENGKYPEEFWACSDFAITSDGEPNPTPAPTAPIPDCLEPVEPYEQCGGRNWAGSDCCRAGYECTEMSGGESYSEEWSRCVPDGVTPDDD